MIYLGGIHSQVKGLKRLSHKVITLIWFSTLYDAYRRKEKIFSKKKGTKRPIFKSPKAVSRNQTDKLKLTNWNNAFGLKEPYFDDLVNTNANKSYLIK